MRVVSIVTAEVVNEPGTPASCFTLVGEPADRGKIEVPYTRANFAWCLLALAEFERWARNKFDTDSQ